MSKKNKPLLETDIKTKGNDLFYNDIVRYSEMKNKNLKEIRVLDWGCGRGHYVSFLLNKEIDACGVDIDTNVISQAKELFDTNGWSFSHRMRIISEDNKTDFPNDYFDVIISDQVIEHIKNLKGLSAELYRITKNGGIHIHRWPAKFKINEPHLFMPFVHWLPKGVIRKYLIFIYVISGVDPKWKGLTESNILEKTEAYYNYSIKKTYYRFIFQVRNIFKYFPCVDFSSNLKLKNLYLNNVIKQIKVNNTIGLQFSHVIMKLRK